MLGEGEGGRGGGRGDVLQESIQQPETVCAMEIHTCNMCVIIMELCTVHVCNTDTLQYSGELLKDANFMVCGLVFWQTSCLQLHHKVFSLISFP